MQGGCVSSNVMKNLTSQECAAAWVLVDHRHSHVDNHVSHQRCLEILDKGSKNTGSFELKNQKKIVALNPG